MNRSRIAAGIFATAAIIAASLLSAAPAAAATLPKGATINVVDANSGAIYGVNSTNAEVAEVGTASGVLDVTAIDVDATGVGFAITNPSEGASELYAANAVTGTLDFIAAINFGDVLISGCDGLDLLANGDLIAVCTIEGDDSETAYIGVLDKETGFLDDSVIIENDFIYALASSPAGQLYAFGEDDWDIYLVDLAGGTALETVSATAYVLGADFDIAGTLWITTAQPEDDTALGTLNVATGEITVVGEYAPVDGSTFSFTTSLTVWGGALAATGAPLADAVPLGLGALLLVAAGVALAATRRVGTARVA